MMKKNLPALLAGLFCILTVSGGEHIAEARPEIPVKGFQISYPENAGKDLRKAAENMARILGVMTKSDVRTSSGPGGIRIGVAGKTPGAVLTKPFDVRHPGEQQGYEIDVRDGTIFLTGATELAAEYAVYDFLYRLGWRHYFPGPDWEVIPVKEDVKFGQFVRESPDYYRRHVTNEAVWGRVIRGGGYPLSTGHAYEAFIKKHKKLLAEHPEYMSLVNGERKGNKLCISNPGLRKAFVDWVLTASHAHPEQQSYSAEPSDGDGWCECEECAKLGTPSDRALFLANEMARALAAEKPLVRVGMYAYNKHSSPPSIEADPHVVLSAATSFIAGGLSYEEIFNGWAEKVREMGVRDYLSVWVWSKNLPGRDKGARRNQLRTEMPHYYSKGARYYGGDTGTAIASMGVGVYMLSRILWDVRAADDPAWENELREMFENLFGPAAEIMRGFFDRNDGLSRPVISENYLADQYGALLKAWKIAGKDPAVRTRLAQLAAYIRYCEMVYNKADRVDVARYLSKIIRTRTVDVYGAYHDSDRGGADYWKGPHLENIVCPVAVKLNAQRKKKKASDLMTMDLESADIGQDEVKCQCKGHRWNSAPQFTDEELWKFVIEGQKIKRVEFTPVSFEGDLRPAPELTAKLPAGMKDGQQPEGIRGLHRFHLWCGDTSPVTFTVSCGYIYQDAEATVKLIQIGGASETGERETLIASENVPPDKKERTVTFTPKNPGLHMIEVNDHGVSTHLKWPATHPGTFEASPEKAFFSHRLSYFFYVPKDTKKLIFFSDWHAGSLIRPDGKTVLTFKDSDTAKHYSVDVPEGQDGRLWYCKEVFGSLKLLNVPPYVAYAGSKLLLPSGIVEQDSPRK